MSQSISPVSGSAYAPPSAVLDHGASAGSFAAAITQSKADDPGHGENPPVKLPASQPPTAADQAAASAGALAALQKAVDAAHFRLVQAQFDDSPAEIAAAQADLTAAQAALAAAATPVTAPTLPPAPLLPANEVQAIQTAAISSFLDTASAAPDGSDLKTTYNLYKTLAIGSQVPELSQHVDINQANTDLQAYLQKPDVVAAMQSAVAQSTPGVTAGTSAATIVTNLSNYLTDPNTVAALAALRQTNPAQANQVVNDVISQVSFFDQGAAKTLLSTYVAASVSPANVQTTLATADIKNLTLAVSDTFQVGVTESRFGVGALANSFAALAKLTPAELASAGQTFAAAIAAVPNLQAPGAEAALQGAIIGQAAAPTVTNALIAFANRLKDTGTLGTLGGGLATLAVINDFRGEGTATTGTAWGRTAVAADIMSVIGAAEPATNFVTTLGEGAKQLYSLLQSPVPAYAPGVELALAGVNLGDFAAVDAALNANADVMAGLASGALTTNEVSGFAESISEVASTTGADFGGEQLASLYGSGSGDLGLKSLFASEVGDDIASAGAASVQSIAGEIQAAGPAAGLAADEAATAAAEIVQSGGTAVATAGEAGISATALVFKGLGALGSAANILYAVGAFNQAKTDLDKGEQVAGTLDIASGLSLSVSAAVGLGAAAGSTAELLGAEAFFTGPAFPLVAAGTAVLGAALGLASYFYKHNERDDQVDDLRTFLTSGVGTGHDYLV